MQATASAQAADPLAGDHSLRKLGALGQGSFGSVGLYQRIGLPLDADGYPQDDKVAIKCLPVRCVDFTLVSREVRSHCSLNHPHVILFKRLGLTADRRYIYLMMEYADSGDLFKYVQQRGRLPEGDARWFFQQIILALDYCHRRGVVNRDLKLENLLLKSAAEAPPPPGQLEDPRNLHIKVADFGLCKTAVTSLPKSRVGTLYYMAPEVLRASADRPYSGVLSDIWSVGCILYVLLFKAYPFGSISDRDSRAQRDAVIRRIASAEWQLPASPPVSEACRDLLKRILVPDPGKRITMEGVLNHPWFLEELPEGARGFNATLVEEQERDPPRCEQSMEEINAILRSAEAELFRQPMFPGGGGTGGGAGGLGGLGPGGGGLAGGPDGTMLDAATAAGGDSGIDGEIDELHAEHPSLFEMGT
ncbi:hypothetical protein HYH03_002619 [Edaphochlamys debaryana]|uniref:non-specific serine/threonine protein kinase n=1 Tax=Edaphochlamys debaryana TaxID=47281 RepID=A0A835YL42_9CHLO|nr:hypothetical protein HYH03_002619 [Edaphochlamys debaryana]|eukprot:KAG2499684.1 hypothetical protein HYH03_002619 [Edaphochlamys debaryana]